MRGLGRLIGKAAAGAAPVALEKWRNDVLAKRDEKLRQYEVQDRDLTIANSNEQARLNREQDTSQFNQTMQQRQTEFGASHALDERRTAADERRATAEEGRVGKLMEQLDIAIQSDQLALEDRQALQKLYTELEGAESPEEQDALLNRIFARQGKERDPEFKFIEGSTIDEATGERISTLFRANQRSGEVEFIGPGSELGGGGGLTVPQGAIDELLKDPSPEAIAEFNEVFGAGAADQYTQQGGGRSRIQDTDTAAPAASTPPSSPRGGLLNMGVPGTDSPGPNQRMPPAGGQQREPATIDNDSGRILDGFEEVKPMGNPRGQAMMNPGRDTSGPTPGGRLAGQMEAGRRATENRKKQAAQQVKELLADKKLPSRSSQRQLMLDAIESGLLSEEEVDILTAHLNQK